MLPAGEGVAEEEGLRQLFMRIDADCDGTTDWDEFSGYLLLENAASAGGGGGAGGAAAGGRGAMAHARQQLRVEERGGVYMHIRGSTWAA